MNKTPERNRFSIPEVGLGILAERIKRGQQGLKMEVQGYGVKKSRNKVFPMNRTSMSTQVGLIRVQTQ